MKRLRSLFIRALLSAVVLGAAAAAHADAALRSAGQLKLALRSSPPCCVIDARPDAQREGRPLGEALAYRDDLKIVPTATVVVVAESDARALAVARALAGAHPGKTILAVEGGVAAWQSVLAAQAGEPPGGRAFSFVIPKNTCEQGEPLQHLRTEPK
jgi:hypothetical protein